MRAAVMLIGHGLATVLGQSAISTVVGVLCDHLTDQSKELQQAVGLAHRRAWSALGVALGGDGLVDRFWRTFVSGDVSAFRQEVGRFLNEAPALPFVGRPEGFRANCLADYQRLLKSGALN